MAWGGLFWGMSINLVVAFLMNWGLGGKSRRYLLSLSRHSRSISVLRHVLGDPLSSSREVANKCFCSSLGRLTVLLTRGLTLDRIL